jgi:hypothetical protein
VHAVKAYVNALKVEPDNWQLKHSFRNLLTEIPFSNDIAELIPDEFHAEKCLYCTTVSHFMFS